jgi:hypothetical protein
LHPACDEARAAADELRRDPMNCSRHAVTIPSSFPDLMEPNNMANREQRSSKQAKKPKKDTSPPKPIAPIGVTPVTVVADRSKKKK